MFYKDDFRFSIKKSFAQLQDVLRRFLEIKDFVDIFLEIGIERRKRRRNVHKKKNI